MKKLLAKELVFIMALIMVFTSVPFLEVEAFDGATGKSKITAYPMDESGVAADCFAPAAPLSKVIIITIEPKKKKKRIALSKKKLIITKGDYKWIRLKNAKAKNVKWYSANKKIATVKKDGSWCRITAKKTGNVKIKAKYKGKIYTCSVKVKKTNQNAVHCSIEESQFEDYEYLENDVVDIDLSNYEYFCDDDDEDPNDESILVNTKINNIVLTYEIDDPSIATARWGEWGEYADDDDDEEYDDCYLHIIPHSVGTTWVTITNSYNNQVFEYEINVYDSEE